MELFKEQICRLRLTDFNCYGQLRASIALDLFQDLATQHCAEMGIGLYDLKEKGIIWVVVRQKLEFNTSATCTPHQEVCVRTWPHSATKLNIMRDYSLCDKSGNTIAKGTSEWLMLNIENRKVASVLANYEGSTNFFPDRAFEGKLRKIKDFEAPSNPALVVVPQFSDVDFNMHVNNARYVDFIQNAVSPSAEKPITSLQIDYRKEVMPGEPLQLFTVQDELGTHVKGINAEGEICFNSLIS